MEEFDVVITGAGMWGLVAAHTFLEIVPSLSLLIVEEKSSVGGVWSKQQLYPGLRTNNLQGHLEFSDFPMLSADLGVQPRGLISGEQVHEYLHKFAKHYGLYKHIRLQTRVVQAQESDSNGDGKWTVELENSDASGSTKRNNVSCSKLVVATGNTATPHKPAIKGMDSFDRPLFHSVDHARSLPVLLKDPDVKEVTVLGGGKSAHDAVHALATGGKKVTWLIRRSGRGVTPMAKPYTLLGPFSFWLEGLLMSRPLSWFGAAPWAANDGFSLIRNFLHRTWLGNVLVRGLHAKMTAESAVAQTGLLLDERTKTLVPDETLLWFGTQASILNYDGDFYDPIRDGRVTVIREDIDHLASDGSIVLQKGHTLQTDALICATGWKHAPSIRLEPAAKRNGWGFPVDKAEDEIFPELDAQADIELLAHFPILRSSPRQRTAVVDPELDAAAGAPSGLTPWRLWRFMAPPSQVPLSGSRSSSSSKRNLVFLNSIASYQNAIKAELTSLWAYAYLNGELEMDLGLSGAVKPSEGEARYEAALWSRFERLRTPYGLRGRMADFLLDALPFHDLLLRDLGLSGWRKGWGLFGEVFSAPYGVKEYAGVRGEWLARRRERKGEKEGGAA